MEYAYDSRREKFSFVWELASTGGASQGKISEPVEVAEVEERKKQTPKPASVCEHVPKEGALNFIK